MMLFSLCCFAGTAVGEALANARQATVCTGFYYVCSSELDSFLAEKAKNCDIDEVGYAILHDC